MASPSSDPTSNANAPRSRASLTRGADGVQHSPGRRAAQRATTTYTTRAVMAIAVPNATCRKRRWPSARVRRPSAFRARSPSHERVVEHHSPRGAQPGDVRVQLRRPLVRVGHEHFPHRARTVTSASSEHRVPSGAGVLERPELLLTIGSSTTGATKLSRSTTSAPVTAGDEWPRADWKRLPAQPTRPASAGAGQHRADRRRAFSRIERERRLPTPGARSLYAALVQQPEPDGERQPDERGRRSDVLRKRARRREARRRSDNRPPT